MVECDIETGFHAIRIRAEDARWKARAYFAASPKDRSKIPKILGITLINTTGSSQVTTFRLQSRGCCNHR